MRFASEWHRQEQGAPLLAGFARSGDFDFTEKNDAEYLAALASLYIEDGNLSLRTTPP